MLINFYKVTALPTSLSANSLYFVEDGAFCEFWITDSSGNAKPVGNSQMVEAIVQAMVINNLTVNGLLKLQGTNPVKLQFNNTLPDANSWEFRLLSPNSGNKFGLINITSGEYCWQADANGVLSFFKEVGFKNGSFTALLSQSLITANRNLQLPDKDGTLATLDDISTLSVTPTQLNNEIDERVTADQQLATNIYNKQDSLGYTPENVANRVVDYSSPSNNNYPTTQANIDKFLQLSGGVMTGHISQPLDPTNAFHLTNKTYIDNLITGIT